jgi:L-fucose mutarotase/ribose pyranase (RbsD/FucU family)
VHSAKCLRAKKLYCVFHTSKNNVLACILVLISNLLKSIEHWPKYQKQKKIFCVVLVSGIMNLYVKCIPDIKKVFSFDNIEQLGFYPLR